MSKRHTDDGPAPVELVAVIELGTTSIRMVLSEYEPESGKQRAVESLQQAVTLGKDTFTLGYIQRETTEACVRVLRTFRRLLGEYHLTDSNRIRAVATSAVREASNRDDFVDRLFIGSGINVEVIDEAEVNRYTYEAVRPLLEARPELKNSDILAVEVGGGSVEALMFCEGRIASAHTYRLGSLRLRNTIEEYRAPPAEAASLMRDHVDRTVERIRRSIPARKGLRILGLGGDIRLALAVLSPQWDRTGIGELKVADLTRFSEDVLSASPDEIVRRHHVSYPDAETLGPALLVYERLAQVLKQRTLLVGTATLRDGILREMTRQGHWTAELKRQVINSALETGRRFDFNQTEAKRTADMARQMFHALQDEHMLTPRHEVILSVAALLSEIGNYISNRAHHKHSMYLIRNSDIFGLSSKDIVLASLVARYHRRAFPRPTHQEYASLERNDRVAVSKMAAILRLARALARGHGRSRGRLHITLSPGLMHIGVRKAADVSLAQHALRDRAVMFSRVYGMEVVLEAGQGDADG
ncbi:MAG: exopolyphosphatase [Lentisphaerae bacterium]|nr:exopolyphosphatase [Lentisphaerota bacterium]